MSPDLLAAIAWEESGYAVDAVNPDSGTVGLMQIHPIHFTSFGWQAPTNVNRKTRRGSGGTGWFKADANIEAGAKILRDALNRHGEIRRALQAYCGASTMSRASLYIRSVLDNAARLAAKRKVRGRWN